MNFLFFPHKFCPCQIFSFFAISDSMSIFTNHLRTQPPHKWMAWLLAWAVLNFLPSCSLSATSPKNNICDICTASMPTHSVFWLDAPMHTWMCILWEYIIPNWAAHKVIFKSSTNFSVLLYSSQLL